VLPLENHLEKEMHHPPTMIQLNSSTNSNSIYTFRPFIQVIWLGLVVHEHVKIILVKKNNLVSTHYGFEHIKSSLDKSILESKFKNVDLKAPMILPMLYISFMTFNKYSSTNS
jgi:hypothetical protein